ncbi:MAG: ferrochelatase [Xanthomonadaceae bacterium]|nr:ferrochelatase [Xanthomonadaceae bacterium]
MHTAFHPAPATPADRDGLLLVNLGTPEAPTPAAVRRYLAEFLHDHRVVDLTRWLWCPLLHGVILPLRAPRVAKAYAGIWTEAGSPLLAGTRRLGQAVADALPGVEVRVAMRYGQPAIGAVMREMAAVGVGRLLVLPLYPQYSASTSASVHDAVMRELLRWRRQPALHLVQDYHRDPAWVAAVADSVRAHWATHGRGDRLLMSFHGIPQRFVRGGDPYPVQCEASARAIAAALGLAEGEWWLTYQSRFGREPWLQPYTDQTLEQWGRERAGTLDVVCPGFAIDCLETLEEIAKENAHAYVEAGGTALRYVPCLNDGPAHVAALAALARRTLGLEG